MSVPADISDEEMLARLAACDLSAAERVHSRLMAAEEAGDIAELGRTYQRIARSLRQTLALKARLKREAAEDVREAARDAAAVPPPPFPRDEARIDARVEELRAPMHRVIWAEHEPAEGEDPEDDEAGYFADLLEERLYLYSRDNRFGLEPLDEHVVKLCGAMTLSVALARRWRDLPDPPPGAFDRRDDDEPTWRGSG